MLRIAAVALFLSIPGLAAAQDCASYAQFKADTTLTLESLDEAAVYRAADDLRASFLTVRVGDG